MRISYILNFDYFHPVLLSIITVSLAEILLCKKPLSKLMSFVVVGNSLALIRYGNIDMNCYLLQHGQFIKSYPSRETGTLASLQADFPLSFTEC